MKAAGAALALLPLMSQAANYSAKTTLVDGVEVVQLTDAAWVTSRLDFWKYPDLMEQFPFAHSIEMTYRLVNGALEVETILQNQSSEPMPVAIGYHPYFQVHDAPRNEWRVHVAARDKF